MRVFFQFIVNVQADQSVSTIPSRGWTPSLIQLDGPVNRRLIPFGVRNRTGIVKVMNPEPKVLVAQFATRSPSLSIPTFVSWVRQTNGHLWLLSYVVSSPTDWSIPLLSIAAQTDGRFHPSNREQSVIAPELRRHSDKFCQQSTCFRHAY